LWFVGWETSVFVRAFLKLHVGFSRKWTRSGAHWRKAIRHAQTLVESVAGGKVPRGMLRHVGQVTDPPLDWRTLLWRFLV
jgi:predicted metal-dependent peptidase